MINIVLKDNADQLTAGINAGCYTKELGDHLSGEEPTKLNSYLHSNELFKWAGASLLLNANYGVRLGNEGSLNVTGELLSRGATDRAPEGGERIIGDSKVRNATTWFNLDAPLADGISSVYAFGGLNYRNGLAGAWYRSPDDDRNIPSIYPEGFVPSIRTHLNDQSMAAGIKSRVRGWQLDFSHIYGSNRMHYFVENSLNASLLEASPREFDAGGFSFAQNTSYLTFSRLFALLKGVSLAWGFEHRLEPLHFVCGRRSFV